MKFITEEGEPRAVYSQREEDYAPGDEELPPVSASASVDAIRIINELVLRLRVEGDTLVIPDCARHRMAMALQDIRDTGYLCEREG